MDAQVPTPPRAALPSATSLVLPLLAGGILRLVRFGWQLPFGDELHAVRVVASHPPHEILARWFESDPSPPLAALYALWVGAGAGLDETVLRLPSLICGLAALVAIPLWLRARAPRLAVPLAWLLALSSGLVLYSRIARPYMPVALLGFLAVVSFLSWWRRPRATSGAFFVASAALALWLFVGVAPFVAAFCGFAAWAKVARKQDGPSPKAVATLAIALVLAVALFLVPGWQSFLALLRDKPTGSPPALGAVLDTLQLLAGTRHPAPAVLFWLLAVFGLVVTARRDAQFASLCALAASTQLAGMLVLSPVGIANPVVLGRYLLIALPLVLYWVAVALDDLGERSRVRFGRLASVVVPGSAIAALFLAGPFVDRAWLSTSFLPSEEYVGFHAARSRLPAEAVPEIYRTLAASNEPGAVLEYTGSPTWNHLNHLSVYQEIHRRRVLFAPEDDADVLAPGITLRNLVAPRPAAFLASPARYLVVHRDTAREVARLERPGGPRLTPFGDAHGERARRHGGRMVQSLAHRWGRPHYEDEDVVVWDLAAARERREQGRPAPR